MHHHDDEIRELATTILQRAQARIAMDPIPLGNPTTALELAERVGETITPGGIGGPKALDLFSDVLEPTALSVDYPRYLSFVPAAPTEASVLFDLIVGASSIYGGSWIEGCGAVYVENEALAWLADLAGYPESAGGVFVPGGTVGNLSALVAGRDETERRRGTRPQRWAILCSAGAHSSVASAAAVMDADVITVATASDGVLTGAAVRQALERDGERVGAVVATAGTTNLGLVDDLDGIASACADFDVWFHVDGAYGAAAMASPTWRPLFAGIERADSFIVDPHKWLFAPFDCCALLYRDPEAGRRAHAQHADYLSFLDTWGDWNPSDFAIHLTRRARGLPFWFSLATHGTDAYAHAIDVTMDLAREAARQIDEADHLRLVLDPVLSIVVFERLGWSAQDYQQWSIDTMRSGEAFVVPSRHDDAPVLRFCFVNPLTTAADIAAIVASLS